MRARRRIFIERFVLRAAVATAACVMTLLAVRLAWGRIAEHRLAEARRALAAAGIEQSAAEPVEDAQNAVPVLREAVRRFDPQSFRSLVGGSFNVAVNPVDSNWSPGQRNALRKILAAEAEVMQEVDAAGRRRGAYWEGPFDELLDDGMLFSEKLRTLQDLIVSAAVVAHLEGADDVALDNLHRLLVIEKVLVASDTLGAHALCINGRARIAAAADRISDTLVIDVGARRAGEASPQAVRVLIGMLLEDRAYHEQFARGCANQLLEVDPLMGRAIPDNALAFTRPPSDLGNWWLQPLVHDEQRRALEAAQKWVPVIRSGSFEPYRLMPAAFRPDMANLSQLVFTSSSYINIQMDRSTQQHFRSLTDGRATAVLLAVRLAEMVQGVSPVSAEGLVPAFLPMAPLDPFAADGRSLRYRRDFEGPTVWSVGTNGIDEGGSLMAALRGRANDQPDYVYGAAWRAARAAVFGTGAPAAVAPPTFMPVPPELPP